MTALVCPRCHSLAPFTETDPTAAADDARRLALSQDAGDLRHVAMARSASVEPGSQVVTMQVSAEWALIPEPVSPADPR